MVAIIKKIPLILLIVSSIVYGKPSTVRHIFPLDEEKDTVEHRIVDMSYTVDMNQLNANIVDADCIYSDSLDANTIDTNDVNVAGTGTFNIINAGAITGTSFIIGANTLTTSEWAYLDGLDQALKTTDSPTFDDLTISNPSSIYSLSHDSFADYVANEHIDWTSTASDLYTTGTGRFDGGLGIDAAVNTLYGLNIGGTQTATYSGVNVSYTAQPSAINQEYKGLNFTVSVGSGSNNISSIIGAGGNVSIAVGIGYTGTIASVEGVRAALVLNGNVVGSDPTITDAILFDGSGITKTLGTTVTNAYGLKLSDITAGSTLNYSIYSAGGQGYHAGNFDFGAGIDVTGTTKLGDGGTTNYASIGTTGNLSFVGSAELIIPSSTALPATANVGSLYLDTNAGANGTLYMYSNGAWRAVAVLP